MLLVAWPEGSPAHGLGTEATCSGHGADISLCRVAGRKLLQVQLGGILSAINAGQLNQAAVQQLAQAGFFGAATNGAVVVQGNAAGAFPT